MHVWRTRLRSRRAVTARAPRACCAPVSVVRSPISAAAMYATLGDVLVMGGDFFGAEEAFGVAAQTPGFEARAASGMARVHARLGRWKDMAGALASAAKRTP